MDYSDNQRSICGGNMRYSCDDFMEYKYDKGKRCSVGIFGNDIYAMKYRVSDGHNSCHEEYYQITEEEFIRYSINADVLIEKYYKGHISFLCSNYLGKSHGTYGFEM